MIQLVKKLDIKSFDGVIRCVSEDMSHEKIGNLSLSTLKEKGVFEGKVGETYAMTTSEHGNFQEIILVGIGNEATFSTSKLRKGLGEAYKQLKSKKVKAIGVNTEAILSVCSMDKKIARVLGEVFIMSAYAFDDYKTDKKPSTIECIEIEGSNMDQVAFDEGKILGEANVFSRHLTNMPANVMTPEKLALLAKEHLDQSDIEVEIKGLNEIEALGMHAYLAVAKASTNAPKLIVMRYMGDPSSDQRIAYVGKGLTYDSGGLSVKPTASMLNMKDDMGGASAVIAAMGAIGKLKPKVNIIAVVAACENMIAGNSYKPGDIIQSMGGKSIFIGNTDAEGRLTLIDAVTYAIEKEKATFVLDIATLTGAAIHCLGSEAAPVVSNNDDFYAHVEKAFEKADERIWRMPIFDEYKALVKHEQADLTNSAGSPGTITAGIFIGEFVKEVPWVHIDIAGTAFIDKAVGAFSKGGTGSGARALVYLAKKMSK